MQFEVVSALARLAHERARSVAQRDRAVAAFVADIDAWHVVEITVGVTATARRLLLQHSLRSGAALQLACALRLQDGMRAPLRAFIAHNQRLLTAALAEQLSTIGGDLGP